MSDFWKIVIIFISFWALITLIDKYFTYRHHKTLELIEKTHKERVEATYEDFYAKQISADEETSKSLEIIAEKYNQLYHEAFVGNIRKGMLQVIDQYEEGVEDPRVSFTYTRNGVEYEFNLELK